MGLAGEVVLMGFDLLNGVGYLPRTSQYRASVYGDGTNQNFKVTAGAQTKSQTITINEYVRIDLMQLDLTVTDCTAGAGTISYQVTLNGSKLLFGSIKTDTALIPQKCYQGPIGTVFEANAGDVITVSIISGVGGADYALVEGSLALFGTYV